MYLKIIIDINIPINIQQNAPSVKRIYKLMKRRERDFFLDKSMSGISIVRIDSSCSIRVGEIPFLKIHAISSGV